MDMNGVLTKILFQNEMFEPSSCHKSSISNRRLNGTLYHGNSNLLINLLMFHVTLPFPIAKITANDFLFPFSLHDLNRTNKS